MNRTLLVISFFSIISFNLFSQENNFDKSKLTVGIKINPGISYRVFPNDYTKIDPQLDSKYIDKPHKTIAGGLSLLYDITNTHSIELTALVIDKGYEAPIYGWSGWEEYFQYDPCYMLDFPIMYRYQFNKNRKINFIASAGLGLSVPIWRGGGKGGGYCWWDVEKNDTVHILYDQYYKPILGNAYFAFKAKVNFKKITLELGPNLLIALNSYTRNRETIEYNSELFPVYDQKNRFFPYFAGIETAIYFSRQ